MEDPPPDQNIGPPTMAGLWTLGALTAVIVILRLYTAIFVQRMLGLSDILMAFALIFDLVNQALLSRGVSLGLGRHIFYLNKDQIRATFQNQMILQPFGVTSTTLGRISFAVYLLKIVAHQKQMRYVLHACICALVIVWLEIMVVQGVQCRPFSRNWDPSVPGSCWSQEFLTVLHYVENSVLSVVDVVLTIVPAIVVWNLHNTMRVKLGLAFLLCLSAVAAIASIIKIVALKHMIRVGDATWNLMPLILWFGIESNLVIAAASVPCIRPLFTKSRTRGVRVSSAYAHSGNQKGSAGATSMGRWTADQPTLVQSHVHSSHHAEIDSPIEFVDRKGTDLTIRTAAEPDSEADFKPMEDKHTHSFV